LSDDHSKSTPASAGPERSARAPDSNVPTGGSQANGVRVILDTKGIHRALMRIAHEILERNEDSEQLYLVAIPNGGVPLARELASNLAELGEAESSIGILDTTLYRDDLTTTGERPRLRRTVMPSAVDGRIVVLVDDVVKTGRTIRAAMDALMDFGRPKQVQVVGLVDRGQRELPIKLDFVGKNVPTRPGEQIRLRGSEGALEGDLEVVVLPDDAPPDDVLPDDGARGA
jgi:pyrimidine operon attenuation protein/uracil phosphoribosyltransferase